mmetsp:Transcript_34573/g.78111  ORF Transcript_34573/g.78111 Transcript_34573/m.78111 type:complete len:360 (-) Transcript_34573:73-1152(-)
MKRARDPGTGKRASTPTPAESQEAAASSAQRVKEQQSKLFLSAEGPTNPDSKDFCGAFAAMDIDNSWDHAKFKNGFSINITSLSDELVTFDMVGIDPPLANAFRRILIAEVPTVAISRVTLMQNTSVIHDENLAHRLGLVPMQFEPDNLEWKPADAEFNESNSLKFSLHVVCDTDRRSVYSRDLVWQPWSEEQRKLFADAPPRPVVDDILIAQLRSNQEIEFDCFCEKGVGKEHAKWSPVCTAYYKLLPDISFTKPVVGADAELLKKTCPMGVFDIEEVPGAGKRATVADARKCTTCRECIETFPGEEKGLVLAKAKNHYLFSIESTGSIPAPLLFQKALVKLKEKCETARGVLEQRST